MPVVGVGEVLDALLVGEATKRCALGDFAGAFPVVNGVGPIGLGKHHVD